MKAALIILVLAFFQNVSFSIVSRARNRSSMSYHIFAATVSNSVWFLTMRALVLGKMNWVLFIPYTIGTVSGSVIGALLSMYIEKKLNATSDGHLAIPIR